MGSGARAAWIARPLRGVVAIGDAALALGPELVSLEVNPLLADGARRGAGRPRNLGATMTMPERRPSSSASVNSSIGPSLADASEPVALMAQALHAADADAGGDWLESIDLVTSSA